MPRLPSAADVQQISPRVTADPGVKAPVQAFESPVGVAAEELAPAIEKYAQVALHQENRRDTIDRSGIINAKNLENDAKLRDINKTSDLSNENVMAEYGSFLAQRRQEVLKQHQERGASPDSMASLEVRLREVDDSHIGRAAGISAKIGLDKVDERFKNAINPLALKVSANPSLENINKVMGEFDVQFDDMKGAYNPIEENSRRSAGKEHLALSSLDKLLVLGKTDVADSLLREGGLSQFLSDSSQRHIQHRIDTINESKGKESITTKPVFNNITQTIQFATDKQIVANPNLVPVSREEKTSASINTIYRLAASAYGGVFDQFGNPVSLNLENVTNVHAVTDRAMSLLSSGLVKNEVEAVTKALREAGKNIPALGAPLPPGLPPGTKVLPNGNFQLPDGRIVRPKQK